MEEKKLNFLKKINLKTSDFARLSPSLDPKREESPFDFKDYLISKEDFKRIIKIIKEESLLVETRLTDCYYVCRQSLKKENILQFSIRNITAEMETELLGLVQ